MKKIVCIVILILAIIGLLNGISYLAEGISARGIGGVNVENASATTESSEPLTAMNDILDDKEYLIGIFGGWSQIDQSMWVSLDEDIEGVRKGQAITVKLTDELEEQVTNYEIGDRLYVYYDDISITDEPQITTPYKIELAE